MCYLEGAWTNNENLDEPFESTRHHLDAASWFDLQEKIRFTAYTGDKDQAENFAYLPTGGAALNSFSKHPTERDRQRERQRQTDRDRKTDRQTENSNSKTSLSKDCSLGSFKPKAFAKLLDK